MWVGVDDKDSQETLCCAKKPKFCDAVGNLIFSQILRYGNASVDAFPAIYAKKKIDRTEGRNVSHTLLLWQLVSHIKGVFTKFMKISIMNKFCIVMKIFT